MSTTKQALAAVPVRFLLLGGVAALGALWFTMSVPWHPTDPEAYLGPRSFAARLVSVPGMIALVWAAVPLVALRWPAVAAGVGLLPFGFFVAVPFTDSWPFGLVVALVGAGMVGMWERPRQGLVAGSLALVPVVHCALGESAMLLPDGYTIRSYDGVALSMAAAYAVVIAALLGLAWWMRQSVLGERRAAGLEARAAEVERTSAVVDERARLARDLHDVVAHHVSLIAVRAETGPYTVPDLPPPARELLAEIAGDARRALTELRSVLGVLRRSAEDPELGPQPTASDIAALVAQSTAVGDRVAWTPADLSGVPPTAGYVAYRVVQEALTNARRHAPGQEVRLRTEPVGPVLLIEVSNRVADPAVVTRLSEGGGLAGMRERVTSIGGTLDVRVVDHELQLTASVPAGAAG
ncbi:sensor histidine kinase [Nocardioides sp. SYSU DS0651]|uniref:sensor histidine kinase n=1 Tax=Nocardioides sp. SYSU DS0651 TaxID=3415955 RepID=UPI003F4C03B6